MSSKVTLQNPDQRVGTFRTRKHTLPSPQGRRSALIIVNVQNDYVDSKGSVTVPNAVNTVALVNQLRAKVGWDLIAVSQDSHPEGHVSFYTAHMINPGAQLNQIYNGLKMLPDHCIASSNGAAIHSSLVIEPTDFAILTGENKSVASYSSFKDADGSATHLARVLRQEDITDVYVCGMGAEGNYLAIVILHISMLSYFYFVTLNRCLTNHFINHSRNQFCLSLSVY